MCEDFASTFISPAPRPRLRFLFHFSSACQLFLLHLLFHQDVMDIDQAPADGEEENQQGILSSRSFRRRGRSIFSPDSVPQRKTMKMTATI